MPKNPMIPKDELKKKILDSLKYGSVKTASQISVEFHITWATAYVNLSELEREGRIDCLPSANRMNVWRLKDEKR